jgi:hypothetical protein
VLYLLDQSEDRRYEPGRDERAGRETEEGDGLNGKGEGVVELQDED